ncbi:hypothetical protein Sjap_026117 [Stephania japonica]|uniref:Defensin n=1 Tax=Stephania japonica TaxID=461633 RepID=A0AAP0E303_9MAGN
MASRSVKAISFIAILLFVCLLAAPAETAEVTADGHRQTCKRRMGSCGQYHNCYNYCKSQGHSYYGGGCNSGYCYCYYYC